MMTVVYSKPVQFQSDGYILNDSLTLYQTCVQTFLYGIYLFPFFFLCCLSMLSNIFPLLVLNWLSFFFFWQERFQVKNPPHTYLQKLRSYLDPAVTRKVSALTNMLSCSSGRSTTAAFPSPLTLYLSSRISLQLRKDCTQGFWSRQLGNFSYKTVNSVSEFVIKETVVYLERPGLRNICPAEVSLSKNPWILTNPLWCCSVADSILLLWPLSEEEQQKTIWVEAVERIIVLKLVLVACRMAGANMRSSLSFFHNMIKIVSCHPSSQLWLSWLLGKEKKGVRGGAPWSKVSASSHASPKLSLLARVRALWGWGGWCRETGLCDKQINQWTLPE